MKRSPSLYLGLLPVLLLFALVLDEYLSPSSVRVYEPVLLLPLLNTSLFLAACVIAYISRRIYLISGATTILWIGCGVLTLALGALTAGWLIIPFGPNVNVTIFNVGAFLASICHIGAVVAILQERPGEADPGRRARNIRIGYQAVLLGIALLVLLTIKGYLPPFFIQGQGPTVLRQNVAGWAIVLFGVSALFTLSRFRRQRAAFLYWYSLALTLLALAMLSFLLQPAVGSPLGWVGRSSYVVAAIYFLISVNAGLREARTAGTDLSWLLAELFGPEQYRALFNHLNDSMAIDELLYDAQGQPCDWRILNVNPAYLRATGRSRDDVIGRRLSEIFGLDRAPEPFLSRFARVVQTGEPVQVEGYFEPLRMHLLISAFHLGGPRFATLATDITARRQAEEALRQSEKQYRSLFDHMLEGFAYCQMHFEQERPVDFTYLKVNEAFETLTGLKNVTGKRVSEVIPGIQESAPELLATYGRVALTGTPERFETYLKALDMWFSISVYSPQKEHFVAVFDVITERKRAEENLRRRQAILAGINRIFQEALTCETEEQLGETCLAVAEELTGSKFGFIAELNQEGGLNDLAISYLGWEACKVTGTEKLVVPKNFHVHGLYGICIREEASVIVNDPASHPDRIGIPEGHPPITAFLGVPLKQGGKTIGMIALANKEGGYTDADREAVEALAPAVVEAFLRQRAEKALRESEALARSRASELQAVLDTTPGIIWLADDPECRTISGNRAAYELLRRSPGSNLSKSAGEGERPENFRTIKDGREIPVAELPVQRAAAGEKVRDYEFDLVFDDGSIRHLLGDAVPLLDEAGRPRGAVAAFMDITERQQAETALRQSNQRLDLLAESASRLLASVAPQQVVDAIAHKVMEFLHCDAFFNFLVDEQAGRLHLNACGGIPEEEARRIEWLDYGVAVCGCAARDRCRIVAENIQNTVDERTVLVKSFGIQAYACHPLLVEGRLLGTLSFGTRSRTSFTAEDLALMKAVADQVAIAMDRKLAEDETRKLLGAIQREKEKLTSLINSISDEVWFADTQKNFILANPAALQEFGLTSTDGLDVEKLAADLEVYRPDGQPRLIEEAPPLRALQGELVKDLEEIIRTPGRGELRYRQVSAAPVRDVNGDIIGSVSVARDITELKLAEEALKRAYDELELRVEERTAELKAANEQLLREIEERQLAEKQAEGTGRLYRLLSKVNEMIVRAQDQEELFRQACRIMMEEGDFLFCWIGRVDREAGVVRAAAQFDLGDDYPQNITVSIEDVPEGLGPTGVAAREGRRDVCPDIAQDPRMAPWREAALARGFRSSAAFPLFVGGRVAGVLTLYSGQAGFFSQAEVELLNSLAQDLSFAMESMEREAKRRQAEAEIRRLNEELEQRVKERTAELEFANRELEAFSYSVSHDLKAPLRAVEGFSRMLTGEHAARLDEEGLRLLGVITDNTQIMAKLIDDLLALSRLGRQPIRKSAVDLAAVARKVFAQLREQEPERNLQLTVRDLPRAWGDPFLLSQVMMNLLDNAVKYTRSRETAAIEVGGRLQDGETLYYVKDNGVGFDMRYVHKMFGVFQRLHSGQEYEGTGVGLAIVQRIIQRHGGRVWAEGKVGRGATVYFTLPGQ